MASARLLAGMLTIAALLEESSANAQQVQAPIFPRPNPAPGELSASPAPAPSPPPLDRSPVAPQPSAAAPSGSRPAGPASAQLRASSSLMAAPPPQPSAPVAPPPRATAPEAPAAAPASAPQSPAGSPGTPAPHPPADATTAGEGRHADAPPECVIGSFCIGPVVTAGVLNVFGVGAHARMDYWGVGIDYQFIGLGYRGVDGQLGLLTVEGRVYPFANAFYFSAGFAWQSVGLETVVHVPAMNGLPAFDTRVEGSVNLPLFKLGIGFMGRSGFVLGIDLGFGIKLAGMEVDVQTNLPRIPEVVQAEAEFRAAAESWVEWLPFAAQFNILRLGYLF
jgi:hypothetical protein